MRAYRRLRVRLKKADREKLDDVRSGGIQPVRTVLRALALAHLHEGKSVSEMKGEGRLPAGCVMLPMINALEVQKGKPAMKKNTTELEKPRRLVLRKNKQRELTIGVDLGDKTSRYCLLDREGNALCDTRSWLERDLLPRKSPPSLSLYTLCDTRSWLERDVLTQGL